MNKKGNELIAAIEWGAAQICGDFDYEALLDWRGQHHALRVIVTKTGAGKMLMHTADVQLIKESIKQHEAYWNALDDDEFKVIIEHEEGTVYDEDGPSDPTIDYGMARYFQDFVVDMDAGCATLRSALEGPGGPITVWEKSIGKTRVNISVETDPYTCDGDYLSGDPESDCSTLLMLASTPATCFAIHCKIEVDEEQVASTCFGGCMVLVSAYDRNFDTVVIKDYGRELLREAIAEARETCPKKAMQKEEVKA